MGPDSRGFRVVTTGAMRRSKLSHRLSALQNTTGPLLTNAAASQRTCSICGHNNLSFWRRRLDGRRIVRCDECGMGVLEDIPTDLSILYDEAYYRGGAADRTGDHGYSDYSYTVEHGVGWAADFIQLLSTPSPVLDIGCVDGTLLLKLDAGYELFGIEMSEAVGQQASARGVNVIGRDLLDRNLLDRYEGKFDVVSSIAVFEHLSDIRAGFDAALRLMKDDGVLLFEVPLMASGEDNATWMSSSLEHVWYPSEQSIVRLIEAELGAFLFGRGVSIRNYAWNYIGVITKSEERANQIRPIVERVLLRSTNAIAQQEQIARMRIGLIHAADSTHHDLSAIAKLPQHEFTPTFLRRLVEVWQNDLWRIHLAASDQRRSNAELLKVQVEYSRLKDRLNVYVKDSVRNEVELTREILRLKSELRMLSKQLDDIAPSHRGGALAAGALSSVLEPSGDGSLQPFGLVKSSGPTEREGHPRELEMLTPEGRRELPFPVIENPWPADRPLVSVIITSFNYGEFVENAVNSVLKQTFKNLEVIVIEGGSTDDASRLRVANLDRSRVRVLMQGQGQLAGANRNCGISYAQGKYVCCLDADDTLRSTYIEKAVFLLERHNYDLVSSAQECFGEDTAIYHVEQRPDLELLMRANNVLTSAVFRRSLWEKAGGYRDADRQVTGHVHEDWSLWVRLAAIGARIINLSRDPMLLYRVHRTSLSRGADVLSMERQRELIRLINADVVSAETKDRSKIAALTRAGTAVTPRPPIYLDGAPPRDQARVGGPVLLIAMPFLVLGGAERLLSSVVAGLTRNGWRVVIMTSIDTGPVHGDTTSWFEEYTSEIFHLPRFLERDLWEDFLLHLTSSRSVDLLLVVGSAFVYDNLRSLKILFPRIKVVDLLFNTQGHTENNRRRSAFIDLIIVENEEVRQWLLVRNESPQRVCLIESGVDISRIQPTLRSAEWREKNLLGSDDLLIGFCGRWSEEKDPLAFVEIARRTDPDLPVRFVMTGAGSMGQQIAAAVEQANFPAGRFTVLGEVPDIDIVLASLDLLVLPSRLDGRPVVVMEALAAGTPVLASNVGGLPGLIHHGVSGWLCRPGAYDDFVEIVRLAVKDRAALARMRAAARSSAERHLNIDIMLANYEAALRSVIPCAPDETTEQ